MSIHVFSLRHEGISRCSSKQLIDFGLQRFLLSTTEDIIKPLVYKYCFWNRNKIVGKSILCSPSHLHLLQTCLVLKSTPEKQKQEPLETHWCEYIYYGPVIWLTHYSFNTLLVDCINKGCSTRDTNWLADYRFEVSSLQYGHRHLVFRTISDHIWQRGWNWAYANDQLKKNTFTIVGQSRTLSRR